MAEDEYFSITSCRMTFSNKVSIKDGKLLTLITDKLQFKITGFDPLTVEKDLPTEQEILLLFNASNDHFKTHKSKNKESFLISHIQNDFVEVSQNGPPSGEFHFLEEGTSKTCNEKRICKQSLLGNNETDKVIRIRDERRSSADLMHSVYSDKQKHEIKKEKGEIKNFDIEMANSWKAAVTADFDTQMFSCSSKATGIIKEAVDPSDKEDFDQPIDSGKPHKDMESFDRLVMEDYHSIIEDTCLRASHCVQGREQGNQSKSIHDQLDLRRNLSENNGKEEHFSQESGNRQNKMSSPQFDKISCLQNRKSELANNTIQEMKERHILDSKDGFLEKSEGCNQGEIICSDSYKLRSLDQAMKKEESHHSYDTCFSRMSQLADRLEKSCFLGGYSNGQAEKVLLKSKHTENDMDLENEFSANELKEDYLDGCRNYNILDIECSQNETTHTKTHPFGLPYCTEDKKKLALLKSVNDKNVDCSSLPNRPNVDNDFTVTYFQVNEHEAYTNTHDRFCAFSNKSQLKVQVYKANIIELEVDCIVNAANKDLEPCWGVSKAISVAAGPSLRKECEDHINTGRVVDVTNVFVSTGGNLAAKYVLHAVGPNWSSYNDKDRSQWFDKLRHTVLRCLVEASRLRMTSVALPSISAAIIKVPKDQCARCYMEAVKHFDIFNVENRGTLQEIHFVDIDEIMVNINKECFSQSWARPCDLQIAQKDCDFAEQHLSTASKVKVPRISDEVSRSFEQRKIVPTLTRKLATASVEETAEQSERSTFYHFGNITLYIESNYSFSNKADIIITIGKAFDKLSGSPEFRVGSTLDKYERMPSKENSYEFFNVHESEKAESYLLCEVYPEPDTADKIPGVFRNLGAAIRSFEISGSHVQRAKTLVLSSSILYSEQKEKKETYLDVKKVGKFAQCLYTYLDMASRDSQEDISITVVGSEDALPTIEKVMESYDVKKTVTRASSQTDQGAESMPLSVGQSSEYETHSRISDDIYVNSEFFGFCRSKDCEQTDKRAKSMVESERNESRYELDSKILPLSISNGVENSGIFRTGDFDTPVETENLCNFCYENKSCDPAKCCKKLLCHDCRQRASVCPFCNTFWRIITGDQPPGTMSVVMINDSAAGYEKTRTWEIEYNFPAGTQKKYHPNPGKTYDAVKRKAYVPANIQGLLVLMLLRLAFIRKLTFTIGYSLSRGEEGLIIWNDISHKTKLHGGMYGYPDPNYLNQVTLELSSKGVMLDTITESERHQLEHFRHSVINFQYFSEN